jgi:hypothetical protein
LKNYADKGKKLLAESRREIVGGLVVALVVLAVPKLVNAVAGVSIEIPLIVLPIAFGVLVIAFLASRAILWTRRINQRLHDLEVEAAAHADSLEVFEQTISLPDAIRAAEARGWEVEVKRSETGIHHEMIRANRDGRGEVRIGGGIDFTDDEAAKRRPDDNERLLASMILSTTIPTFRSWKTRMWSPRGWTRRSGHFLAATADRPIQRCRRVRRLASIRAIPAGPAIGLRGTS